VGRSSAQAKWVFGAGPFQSGTIFDGTQFAGEQLDAELVAEASSELDAANDAYRSPAFWADNLQRELDGDVPSDVLVEVKVPRTSDERVQPAGHEEPVAE
jgi:hypothetical protein